MNLTIGLIVAGVVALAALVWALIERGRASRAEVELRLIREQAEANRATLKAVSAEAAREVSEALVARATESFQAQDRVNQAKLEAQLKPVAETLAKFQEQVTQVEKSRAEDTGGLKAQIEQLMGASAATQEEARKLSQALRRGAGIQGRWGEQMLRNVLEMAGLRSGIDFDEQVSIAGDEGGQLRPDVIVRLPGGGVFVIDSKVSLNDYLTSLEQTEDGPRELALKAHEESIRRHVTQLSSKTYWAQFDRPPISRSPDIVAMFVPLESAFACVAERAPALVAEAWEKKVAIITPAALFPLLKAVAYGWRAEDQAANSRQIADLGRELYKRLSVMGGHITALGGDLSKAVGRYNQFVGSLEQNVLPQARKFEDLKVDHGAHDLPTLQGVDAEPRPLIKLVSQADPSQ